MAKYLGDGKFQIEGGDNLWNIAQSTLGSGGRWGEITGFSGDPRSLPIGTVVTVPGYRSDQEKTSNTSKKVVAPKPTTAKSVSTPQAVAKATSTYEGEDVATLAKKKIADAKSRWEKVTQKWRDTMPSAPGPFEFDEAVVREQVMAESGIPEYYSEKINNYLTDVRTTKRQFSLNTVDALDAVNNAEKVNKQRAERELREAIQMSNEGNAARGVYFSGQRGQQEEQLTVPVQEFLTQLERSSQIGRLQEKQRAIEELGYEGAVKAGIVQDGEDPVTELLKIQGGNAATIAGGGMPVGQKNYSAGIAGRIPTNTERYQTNVERSKETDILGEILRRKNEEALPKYNLVADEYKNQLSQYQADKPSLESYI